MKVIAEFEKCNKSNPNIEVRMSIEYATLASGDEIPGSHCFKTDFLTGKVGVALFPYKCSCATATKTFAVGDDPKRAAKEATEWADAIAAEVLRQYNAWREVWDNIVVPEKRVYPG